MSVPSHTAPAPDQVEASAEQRLKWLRVMVRIREFETRCDPRALPAQHPGRLPSSVGRGGRAVRWACARLPVRAADAVSVVAPSQVACDAVSQGAADAEAQVAVILLSSHAVRMPTPC